MDKLSKKQRSILMSKVRSTNTKPEIKVRKMVFKLGFRYRLYRKDLPGKPDMVFVKMKKVIFINGCFWHGHNCRKSLTPKSNLKYWNNKISENKNRDKINKKKLKKMGWSYLVLWECEINKNISKIQNKCLSFLQDK